MQDRVPRIARPDYARTVADAAYYRPSGRVSFVGLVLAWIVGGLVALAGAFVYAALLVYNPSAYLGVLLPMLYGASVGAMTS